MIMIQRLVRTAFFPGIAVGKTTKSVEWFSVTINKELAFGICKFHQKTKQAGKKAICIYQKRDQLLPHSQFMRFKVPSEFLTGLATNPCNG